MREEIVQLMFIVLASVVIMLVLSSVYANNVAIINAVVYAGICNTNAMLAFAMAVVADSQEVREKRMGAARFLLGMGIGFQVAAVIIHILI